MQLCRRRTNVLVLHDTNTSVAVVQYFASTYDIYLSQNIYLKLQWFRRGDRFLCSYLFCWSAFCLHLLSFIWIKSRNIAQYNKITCMPLVREREISAWLNMLLWTESKTVCIVLHTVFLYFSLSIQNLDFTLVIFGF